MAYANYDYYITDYLLGQDPVIPEKVFLFWEKQARVEIDAQTFGRIAANQAFITGQVKDCACAIAEVLYKAHTLTESTRENGMVGVQVSYSNDGQSGTYDVSQSAYTESGKKTEIKRLISRYLGNTGLLYAGVNCLES